MKDPDMCCPETESPESQTKEASSKFFFPYLHQTSPFLFLSFPLSLTTFIHCPSPPSTSRNFRPTAHTPFDHSLCSPHALFCPAKLKSFDSFNIKPTIATLYHSLLNSNHKMLSLRLSFLIAALTLGASSILAADKKW